MVSQDGWWSPADGDGVAVLVVVGILVVVCGERLMASIVHFIAVVLHVEIFLVQAPSTHS